MFSWIPIHREAIHRILDHRLNQKALLALLSEMEKKRLKVISLKDKDAAGRNIPLAEIDPFTFLASFNRGVTDENRRQNWSFLKARWGLKAPVPDDFTGIPILHNMSSWLFPYAGERERDHVGHLWQAATLAAEGGIEQLDEELFNRCLKLKKVGIGSLTIGLFWSYSYEDFIQGFRPTPKGHFDLKYGIFHQFSCRAQRDEAQGKAYVFIIDEINRGNLSKIFGELMMLIEPDKRGKDHAIPLAYSQDADDKFYIPENLHLIGTMNTADRSLAMVDYALRRRFRFVTLRPEFSSEAFRGFLTDAGVNSELVAKIVARMNVLNKVIAADIKNLGPGYQIGHSYFCPRNGIKPDDDWYRRVIEDEILPLIGEYWFDSEQKVKEQRTALLA